MNAPTTPTHKGPQALDIKSATIHTVRIVLHSDNTTQLLDALEQRMQEAGAFFQGEPVVIDSRAVPTQEPIAWETLIRALQQHQLYPIGMMGSAEQQTAAAAYQLPVVELSNAKVVVDIPKPTEPAPVTPPLNSKPPTVLSQPLRSGQRYAAEGDLIVTNMVAHGAEVIATGNIYVHGPLRGKAIAGAHGDTGAFIMATEFEPELIVIAGIYSVIEDPNTHPYYKKGVIVQLTGESLTFEPFSE